MTSYEPPIWQAVFDGDWHCKVTRTSSHTGQLTVSKEESGRELTILNEEVALMYGAVFGADVADVEDWKERVTTAVDNYKAAKPCP